METLKIAIFSWESLYSDRVGGLASAATYMAQTLAKRHEVHFFTRGDKDFNLFNVQYHVWRPYGRNIIEYCNDLSHGLVARFRDFDNPPFDIIHFNDWHVIEAMHLLKERNTVFSFHSTEYGRNGGYFGDWWEFKDISGKEWYGALIAKRVTAVSKTLCNEIVNLYNVPQWKTDVIPNGVVPEQFDVAIDPGDIKRRYGIHPFTPLILYIGRMAYQKGPDLFIDALPAIRAHRDDVRAICAGTGGMLQHLQNSSYGLPVQFTGFISDSEYIRLLNASDIVVIPSRNEPFGIVLLEAWSARKGVVASAVGGLSENISHLEDGVLVEPSPQGIAWGVNEIINNPDMISSIGRKGRKKTDRLFHWKKISEQMVEVYKKAMQ